MAVFICARCGCVDNTAVSDYWSQQIGSPRADLSYEQSLAPYRGRPLCSACGRLSFYKNIKGEIAERIVPGRWHNRFERRAATDKERALSDPRTGIIRYE